MEPVVMTPLRREWQETRAAIDKLMDSEQESNAADSDDTKDGRTPDCVGNSTEDYSVGAAGRVPATAGVGEGAGPGVRQRQLPVHRAAIVTGPGARGDRLRSGPRLARD